MNKIFAFILLVVFTLLTVVLSFVRKQKFTHIFILTIVSLIPLGIIFLSENHSVQYAGALILLSIQLVQLSLEDLKSQEVSLLEILLLIPSIVFFILFQERTLVSLIIPALLGFMMIFLPFIISHGKGLGIADVIIFTMLSLTLFGFDPIFLELFSAVSALFFVLFLQITKKKNNKIPYLPFIVVGWLFLLVFKILFPFLTTFLFPPLPF